jgi:hypothetical protein
VLLNHYAYIIAGGRENGTAADYLVTAENDFAVYGQCGAGMLAAREATFRWLLLTCCSALQVSSMVCRCSPYVPPLTT